jgi:hypothetical protein
MTGNTNDTNAAFNEIIAHEAYAEGLRDASELATRQVYVQLRCSRR